MPNKIVIPPNLAGCVVQPGTWNKNMRIMVYGPYKSGKSYFLASFPKPILAASGGDEQGLAQYLDAGKGDLCFDISGPDRLLNFMDFAMKNEGNFASWIFDPMTAIWDDHLDFWADKLGGEIQGKHWNPVKKSWKVFRSQMKRAKVHVGMSAWTKGVLYEETEVQPGVKKLEIRQYDAPKVEGKLPHDVDLIFRLEQRKNKRGWSEPYHEVIFEGGRRPRTISPKDLYEGKRWSFSTIAAESPWEKIVVPILDLWQDPEGAVELVGMKPSDVAQDSQDVEQVAEDAMVGEILRVILEQTDYKKYKQTVFPQQIAPFLEGITNVAVKQRIIAAHEAKKAELEAKKS